VAVLVGLSLVGTVAESVALVLVARTAVAITSGQDTVDLGLGLVTSTALTVPLALLALAVKLALAVLAAWLGARLSAQTVRVGRLVMLSSYFSADWKTQSVERTGELQDYLTSSVGKLNGVNQSFITGLNALISFAVVTLGAIVINPWAAVGCAFAAAMILLLLRPLSRRTKRHSWAMSDATRDLAGDITESVKLTQEVRVFGVTGPVLSRLSAAEARASGPLERANFTYAVAPVIYQTLAMAFLVLAVGAVALVGGDDVTSLGAAVLLLLRGLTYGQQLQASMQAMANNLPFLDALHERKQLYEQQIERLGSRPVVRVGRLELTDVRLSYNDGTDVLEGPHVRLRRA
jgi:ABC-type multidrug transport system fused ATPase/permease subunit